MTDRTYQEVPVFTQSQLMSMTHEQLLEQIAHWKRMRANWIMAQYIQRISGAPKAESIYFTDKAKDQNKSALPIVKFDLAQP